MYGIHINTSCDWLRIKIALSPLPPCRQSLGVGRSAAVVFLVQQDRTAHFLEREYVRLIGAGSITTFAGGP